VGDVGGEGECGGDSEGEGGARVMVCLRERVMLLGVCACYDVGDGESYGEGAGYDEEHGGARVHFRVKVRVVVRVHVGVIVIVWDVLRVVVGVGVSVHVPV
jgi:hypothetical protein